MSWTDNPERDFDRWNAEQEDWLARLPVCCDCGNPIQQEDAVRIDGKWYCDDCLDMMREGIGDY